MLESALLRKKRALFALLPLLMFSCAKVGLPPGGAEDKSGPTIVSQYPHADTTGVSRRLTAMLEFSEPVNKSSVEAALFLSPDPGQRLRYHWNGRRLGLEYLDSLDANRTYVISVGSQAKDIRGNPVGSSSTIAFSTGDHIDRGRIQGWITDVENPQLVSLWAYRMESDSAPDPAHQQAEYKIQTGKDGNFQFAYLKAGRYRVFAVSDLNHDGLWNSDHEKVGVPPWDVAVTDSTSSWLSFKLTMQDSTPARVRSVREVNQRSFELRLLTPVRSLAAYFVSQRGDTVPTADAFADSATATTWHVFPDSSIAAEKWFVVASGTDRKGTVWSDIDTVDVRERADTSRPHILGSFPTDRAELRWVPDSLWIEFDKPVVVDTSFFPWTWMIAERETLSVRPKRINSRAFALAADTALVRDRNYFVVINGKAIRDYSEHTLADTTVFIRFKVFAEDSLGAIVGNVSTDRAAQYIIEAFEIPSNAKIARTVINTPHPFRLDLLPARKYRLRITRDANGDSTYSYGGVTPFKYSEPFVLPADTITVRARWEQEITLTWKEKP